jgi:hypothetical protein
MGTGVVLSGELTIRDNVFWFPHTIQTEGQELLSKRDPLDAGVAGVTASGCLLQDAAYLRENYDDPDRMEEALEAACSAYAQVAVMMAEWVRQGRIDEHQLNTAIREFLERE